MEIAILGIVTTVFLLCHSRGHDVFAVNMGTSLFYPSTGVGKQDGSCRRVTRRRRVVFIPTDSKP